MQCNLEDRMFVTSLRGIVTFFPKDLRKVAGKSVKPSRRLKKGREIAVSPESTLGTFKAAHELER